jgi:adenosylcobinamide-GDP ribazoletransferase
VTAGARLAVGFLTIVPAGRLDAGAPRDAWLARAAAWFPLVGALVGGAAAGVTAAAGQVLDPAVAGTLGLVTAIVLTRGLHEDGLADTADGLGVHGSRERRLAAMKDSAVGAHGALAMACAFVLAALALAGLGAGDAARALVAAHVLSRTAMVLAAALVRDARPERDGPTLGRGLAVARPAALAATLLGAAGVLVVCGAAAGALALGVAAAALVAAIAIQRRAFGGRTGDTLGATGKLVEVATLVALAGAWA